MLKTTSYRELDSYLRESVLREERKEAENAALAAYWNEDIMPEAQAFSVILTRYRDVVPVMLRHAILRGKVTLMQTLLQKTASMDGAMMLQLQQNSVSVVESLVEARIFSHTMYAALRSAGIDVDTCNESGMPVFLDRIVYNIIARPDATLPEQAEELSKSKESLKALTGWLHGNDALPANASVRKVLWQIARERPLHGGVVLGKVLVKKGYPAESSDGLAHVFLTQVVSFFATQFRKGRKGAYQNLVLRNKVREGMTHAAYGNYGGALTLLNFICDCFIDGEDHDDASSGLSAIRACLGDELERLCVVAKKEWDVSGEDTQQGFALACGWSEGGLSDMQSCTNIDMWHVFLLASGDSPYVVMSQVESEEVRQTVLNTIVGVKND